MGKNKKYRKQAQAEMRVIQEHEAKIARELEKESHDAQLIRKWQKDVRIHQKRLDFLLSKLPGGKPWV